MKKFLFFIVALMAMCVSFSSCSKDDDEVADTSVLIGTWDISHIYTDGEWLDIST